MMEQAVKKKIMTLFPVWHTVLVSVGGITGEDIQWRKDFSVPPVSIFKGQDSLSLSLSVSPFS